MDQSIPTMPEESQEPEGLTEEQFQRLDQFGQSLAKTLKEAMDARKASGIETIWKEDEEHYEGIDDKNRGHGESQWTTSKPPEAARAKRSAGSESIVFPNITRPYVDAAAAKIGDILLPTDDRPWSLKETPVPELVDMSKGILPKEVKQSMATAQTPPEEQAQVVAIEQERASMMIEEAKAKARKAETRIEDWQVEGQYHAEMRRVIDDMCRLGTGILKGPVPEHKTQMKWDSKTGTIIVNRELKPVSKRIDPWNFFPAEGCGESIHNGAAVWERDYLSKRKLEELKKQKGYLAQVIDKCLEEGPSKKRDDMRTTADGKIIDDSKLYEIFYGYCFAEREDVEAAGCKCEDDFTSVPVIVHLVNGRVIKVAMNPLESGEFPYDVIPYQRKMGMPWGTGVARQMRTPQQIVVAGTRTMLTNAGRAAGPVFVMKNNVEGANGSNNIEPWAIFYASEDDTTDDARKFIAMHVIPDLQASLMNIVQFGMKLAEDVTGLPMLLQGQAQQAPDTLGGQMLVDRNASGVLRRIARTVDDCITEPHVRRYYTWLLRYGEDEEKGEFVLDARGSTALVEKELYKQELVQLLQASLNPAFGLSPEKIMAETLRITKRSPSDLQYTDEEKQKLQQAQQGAKPQDNSLAVAEVRAKTEMGKAQLNQQSDMKELEFKAAEAQKQRDHESRMAMLERDVAMMKFANERGMTLEQVKADLAKTVMTLRTQKEMGGTNAATPKVEPRGRAPEGRAFEK